MEVGCTVGCGACGTCGSGVTGDEGGGGCEDGE